MPSSVSFYGGWAGIAVVGAGYWYLQKRKPAPPVKQTKVVTQKQTTKVAEVRKDAKPKKQRVEGSQSSGDQASEKASKKNSRKTKDSTPPVTANVVQEATIIVDDDADEMDNREFARQLSNAKFGTSIGSKPQAGARQKSVKQSRANATKSNGFDASENAASGADADDDMSAADSPLLTATTSKNLGGVADMLEATSSGPSVIRITSPTNPQPKKEKKQAKAPEPVETKKQRQNRQKKEVEKAARDASEADRKVLLEAQRRTAREAEGRAAKDGSSFTAARAPAASSWTASDAAPSNADVQLLDTYDPESKPAASKPAPKSDDHYASLPSEEEQLRLIEEESAWNTVTKPKKGKKKADDAAAKPAVEAPLENTYEPEPIKLPKKQTVEVSWADNNDHGVAKYDIYNDDWAVV